MCKSEANILSNVFVSVIKKMIQTMHEIIMKDKVCNHGVLESGNWLLEGVEHDFFGLKTWDI